MLDIVIVNWNSGDFLRRCVQSVLENPFYPNINSVIVVDNDSSDHSLSVLPADQKLRIINNPGNYGFAKACNIGFRSCSARYVLLLNPDACLQADTLSGCHQLMERSSDTDILGCRLLDDRGNTTHSCSRLPSPLRIFFDAAGLSKIAPRLFHPATIMTDWKHDQSRYVPQVMGAFMFMRTSIFQKYGYFDERFFVYFEEVDFTKRVADAGGKIYFAYNICAVHTGEGTTASVKAFRLFLSLRSRLQYAKKHFSTAGYLLVAFSSFLIEPFTRSVHALLKGQVTGVAEIWRAYRMLLRNQNPG